MTRALVTGAGGFVGRNLVQYLQSAGREVIAMVHSERSRQTFIKSEIEVLVSDIRDVSQYESAAQRADEVYHLASVVAPKRSATAFEVNAGATRSIAECMGRAQTPGRLIYVSSLSAAGPCVADQPRRECDSANPVSIYGKSKLAAEQELSILADRLPISIVRPPGIFGPWDRNLLAMYQSIRWGINTIGISRRYVYSFVHVDDLIAGLVSVNDLGKRLKCASDDNHEGVYFIADPEAVSFEELGNMIASSLGRRPPFHLTVPSTICSGVAFCSDVASRLSGRRVYLNIDKMREARAGSWCCDVTKANEELDFRVADGLSQRIAQTQHWYTEHGWL